MDSKLKNLEITKVDFVDAGANPDADVVLCKHREDTPVEKGFLDRIVEAVAGRLKGRLGASLGGGDVAAEELEKRSDDSTEEPAAEITAPPEDKPLEKSAGENAPGRDGYEPRKGEQEMRIDKSKLTPEEVTLLEALEKKAGIPDGTAPAENVSKAEADPAGEQTEDDIYKGLHPVVKAQLEEMKKQLEAVEEKELRERAKKYELIGKSADELVPMFKRLKAAGGSAYDDMIAMLDASCEMVEKSGVFAEIGKRGRGTDADAWETIEKHADELMKNAPEMTRAEAVVKACEQHPELVDEYENNR